MIVNNTQEDRPEGEPEAPGSTTGMPAEHDLAPVTNLRPTVGDELRMHREKAGDSLESVSEAIRIQKRYLAALEAGRIEELPGTVYALGFLRTYAEHYGLNGDAYVARFKEETAGQHQEQDLTLPEPIEEARVPTTAIIVLGVVLAIGAYAAWYHFRPELGQLVDAVPDVPARLATAPEQSPPAPTEPAPQPAADLTTPSTPAPEVDAPSVAAPTVSAPAVPAPVEPTMQPPAQANATQEQASVEPTPPVDMAPAPAEPMPPVDTAPAPAAVDTAELPVSQPEIEAPAPTTEATPAEQAPAAMTPEEAPAATASAEAPPAADDVSVMTPPGTDAPAAPAVEEPVHVPQTFGASNADARIVISATDDSWIEITDPNGDRLLSRTLRAGDSYRVPNREGLVFVTGNAGGLDITVDGTHVPSIGDTGIVRKNVKLDPELLKQGRAWP